VRGPGGAGYAYGPRGGAAVRGPAGGYAARGPYGGYASNRYYYGGRYWGAPGWGARGFYGYGRGFYGYPGWRYYGTVGLAPALAGIAALSFLSAGVLIGSYAYQGQTAYVYVVNAGDQSKEYQVDSSGNVISEKVVPPESIPQASAAAEPAE
jgi:heterogeneous nuclear ribonucleoprotein A1/A3